MSAFLEKHAPGARFLSAAEVTDSDLGPLAPLMGEWHNAPLSDPKLIANGWNVISVPGQDKPFVFEVIPYTEVLNFQPVVVQAGNRGPVSGGQQVEQLIFGLFYEQQIKSACNTSFCEQRGFPEGTTIHAETGLFLNLGEPNGGYNIARLSTIPHGNALLALGSSLQVNEPGTNFFPPVSSVPTNLDGSPFILPGYTDPITRNIQFEVFGQASPDSFLKATLEAAVGKGSVTDMTVFPFSTTTPNANGGILNIPFIQTNVNATSLDAIFWLENLKDVPEGAPTQLLQYSQNISLVFPPTGQATPVAWPHVTINTLVKVSGDRHKLRTAHEAVPEIHKA